MFLAIAYGLLSVAFVMVNVAKLVRKKLGEILVDEGLVREEQIQEALKEQKASGDLLGEVLIKLKYVSEVDIARALAHQFGLPYIDATKYNVTRDMADLLPVEMMVQNQFVILDRMGKVLILAVSGVMNAAVFEEVELRTGCQLFVYVSTVSQVTAVLKKLTPQGAGVKG